MSSSVIRSTLEGTVLNWAANQSPPIPVSIEDVTFVRDLTLPYLETFLIPAKTFIRSVDGLTRRETGIFQINVWQQSGSGMGLMEGIAESLINLFPVIPKTGIISIDRIPSISRSISDTAGWRGLSISVYYRLESQSY